MGKLEVFKLVLSMDTANTYKAESMPFDQDNEWRLHAIENTFAPTTDAGFYFYMLRVSSDDVSFDRTTFMDAVKLRTTFAHFFLLYNTNQGYSLRMPLRIEFRRPRIVSCEKIYVGLNTYGETSPKSALVRLYMSRKNRVS